MQSIWIGLSTAKDLVVWSPFEVAGDRGDESATLRFKQLSLFEGFSRTTERSGNEAASGEFLVRRYR
jgi:hypothetical protein